MLIRELFDFFPKPSHPASFGKKEGKYPFFTSSNTIDKYVDVADYDGEYLIIGDGGTANCKYYLGKFSASDHNYILKPLDGTNCKLVRYFFMKDNYKTLSEGFKGVGIKNISKTYIQNIEFSKNNSYNDDEIVGTLSNIEQIIDSKMKELSYLNDLIKSRFVEMFGDVISNDKGWKSYVFSEIASSRLGKMLDGKHQTGESTYHYLANYNVQWFRFELENLNSMDFDEADRREFELRDGDLLVCEGGEIGRCAIWHNELRNCYFQKALHRVRCNRKYILPDYLAWWFKYNCDNKGFAAIEGAKATIAHLPGAKLKKLTVVTPPIELQNKFADFVEQTDKLKLSLQKECELYKELLEEKMSKYFY